MVNERSKGNEMYKNYEISYEKFDGLAFVEVVAIDTAAAIADAEQAGFAVVSVRQL